MPQDNNNNETILEQDFPEELKNKAREFFSKGAEVAYALQYDYAIELYLDGLNFWPEAVDEGHKSLREIALRRQGAGGKKSGFSDSSKYKKPSGKTPKGAMFKAEYLLCKDTTNQGYMSDMIKAAAQGGFRQSGLWMADILFDTNIHSSKPSFATYNLLRDIYSQLNDYPRASQACQLAAQMKPNDAGMTNILRDLSAQATMQQGKYDDDSDFRTSIKDREGQEKLQAQGQVVRTKSVLKDAIAQAKSQYQSKPDDPRHIDRLVSALCDTEKNQNEDEAVTILEQAYKASNQFSYKQRGGEIRIKQEHRQVRQLQGKLKAEPGNKEIIQQVQSANQKSLGIELEHYKLCVENYPTDRRVKYEYARCLQRDKRYDEAIPIFQEARDDPHHRIASLNCIGQCFFYKKWFPDAVETFQQTYELLDNKENSMAKELLYNLGRAQEADENIDEALIDYRKVTQIDFNYRDARERVDKLRKQQRENK